MSSISNVGLQEVSLSGHLGAKEHPDTSSIKLGGSPSRERNYFFSPTTEGVDSNNNFVYACLGLLNT